jgi:dihydrofolate reductase
MARVFLDMVMSLDGFIVGLNDEDKGLHTWYFSPLGNATKILDELQASIGAMILGNRTFEIGDTQGGFDDSPYKVPHFILTQQPRPGINKGGVVFTFVEDIDHALKQAKAAAGDKDVCIAGGAKIAQCYLKAGLLDEIQLHLVPVLLGNGIRLFEDLNSSGITLQQTRVLESPGVTHLRYQVIKKPANA